MHAQSQSNGKHSWTRAQEPEEETEDEVRDAVLVTDADGATGELVLLQLILNRYVLELVLLFLCSSNVSHGQPCTTSPLRGTNRVLAAAHSLMHTA
jgi:hypothetical protein